MNTKYQKYFLTPVEINTGFKIRNPEAKEKKRKILWSLIIGTIFYSFLSLLTIAVFSAIIGTKDTFPIFPMKYILLFSFFAAAFEEKRTFLVNVVERSIVSPFIVATIIAGLFPSMELFLVTFGILIFCNVISVKQDIRSLHETAKHYESDILPEDEVFSLLKKGFTTEYVCALGAERAKKVPFDEPVFEPEEAGTEDFLSGVGIDAAAEEAPVIVDTTKTESSVDSTGPEVPDDLPEFQPAVEPEMEPEDQRDYELNDLNHSII